MQTSLDIYFSFSFEDTPSIEENGGGIVLENLEKHEILDKIKELLNTIEVKPIYAEVWQRQEKQRTLYWEKISKFQLTLKGKTWNIVGEYDAIASKGNYEKCQLCGHYPCRFIYVISPYSKSEFLEIVKTYDVVFSDEEKKEEIKKITLHIGDECVLNYLGEAEAKLVKKYRATQIRIYNYKLVGDLPSRLYTFRNTYLKYDNDYYEISKIEYELVRGNIPTKKELIKAYQIIKKHLEVK